MKNILRVLILLASYHLTVNEGISQWAICPKINNPVCLWGDNQYPCVVGDGSGGAIMAWTGIRDDIRFIYTQRITATGSLQWADRGILIAGGSGPVITSDGAGGAIVAWVDNRSGPNFGIYAQRIDATGRTRWTFGGVPVSTATVGKNGPMIVSDGAGGAIIAWYAGDVYAQRIDSTGVSRWTNYGVRISITNPESVGRSTIAEDGAGGAIIAWTHYKSEANYDAYAQRVDSSGLVRWTPNGLAICTALGSQWDPSIISDGDGGAIIAWEDDHRPNMNFAIYAQRVNSEGVIQWSPDGVPISKSMYRQYLPTVISDGAGGAIIEYLERNAGIGSHHNIYVQRVNADGVAQWMTDGAHISVAADNVFSSTITGDGSGGAIITWNKFVAGTDFNIYAQRISNSGSLVWVQGGVPISTAANYQGLPSIISSAADRAIIVWMDNRGAGSGFKLYAQQVHSDGHLYGPFDPEQFAVLDRWNLISIPLALSDYRKTSLFPNGITPAFAFEGSYVPKDTLVNGVGYWLKFECAELIAITGIPISEDSIDVDEGWNLIGSISSPVEVTSIASMPIGITTSEFFGYNGTYASTSTIEPGKAYWVKVNQTGKLILSSSTTNLSSTNRIRIEPTHELPPAVPDGEPSAPPLQIPNQFVLEQNYPNPFNPVTTIRYAVQENVHVTLKMYDVLGREVAKLLDEFKAADSYEVKFDASSLPSGLYFCALQAGKFISVKKLVLIR